MKKIVIWLLALCMALTLTGAMADGVVDRDDCAHHFEEPAYDEAEYIAPTCHTAGQKTQYCLVCNERKYVTIPATASTKDVETEPTCTADGKIDVVCTGCNTVLETKAGKKAPGHIAEDKHHEIEADCCRPGGYQDICKTCGIVMDTYMTIPAYGHNAEGVDFKWDVKDASCTEDGIAKKICMKYGTVLETVELPKWGHDFHDTNPQVVDPTCTTDGYVQYTCQNGCGEIKTKALAATGHDWDAEVTVDATCTEAGKVTKTCKVCGEEELVKEIAALGHDYQLEKSECIEAGCTQDGLDVYYCSRCNKKDLKNVPALGHMAPETHIHPSTCVTQGYKEEFCKRCQYTFSKVDLPLADHTVVLDQVTKQASCTADGLKDLKCAEPSCTWTQKDVVIPARGHNMIGERKDEPYCLKEGYLYQYCVNYTGSIEYEACDYTVIKEVLPALDHDKDYEVTKEPTCSAKGEKIWYCLRCKNSGVEEIDTVDHDIVVVHSASTGSKHAVDTEFCKNCDYEKTEEICEPGAWEETKAATCTEVGERTGLTCTVPGCAKAQKVTEEIPMKPHTAEVIPAVEATCTATGLTEGKKCSVCGEILVAQEVTEKAAHTEEAIPAVEATCTATGLTEGKKCSVCGEITVAQKVTEKAAHTEEAIPAVAATCTATGLTEGKKCSVCGEITVAQKVTEKAAHTEKVIPAVAAACDKTGLTEGKQCTVCGEITVAQKEVAALGHDWQLAGMTKSDCTKDGSFTYICKACGAKDARVIDAAISKEDIQEVVTEVGVDTLVIDLKMYRELVRNNIKRIHFIVDDVTVCIPLEAIKVDAETSVTITVSEGLLGVYTVKGGEVEDITLSAARKGVLIEK